MSVRRVRPFRGRRSEPTARGPAGRAAAGADVRARVGDGRARRRAVDPEGCLICHGDPELHQPDPCRRANRPRSTSTPTTFKSSVHGDNKCSSCHKGFLLTIPQHTEDYGQGLPAGGDRGLRGLPPEGVHAVPDVVARQALLPGRGRPDLHLVPRLARDPQGQPRAGVGRLQDEHGPRLLRALPRGQVREGQARVPLQGPLARVRAGGDLLRLPRLPRQPGAQGGHAGDADPVPPVPSGCDARLHLLPDAPRRGLPECVVGRPRRLPLLQRPPGRRPRGRHRLHDGPPPEGDAHHARRLRTGHGAAVRLHPRARGRIGAGQDQRRRRRRVE